MTVKLNKIIQLLLLLQFMQNVYLVKGENLFLEHEVHELDPFNISIDDIDQEYNYLKIKQIKEGTTIIENNNPTSDTCWSAILSDYIDLDAETENRFVRMQFKKLNATNSFNVIGVEALEKAKIHRIFVNQEGSIGYCYQNEKILNKNNESIYAAHSLAKENMFSFDEGDILQVFYYAEDKSVLIYNQTKDNLFKFPQTLISQLGTRFRIFVGLNHFQSQVILTNKLS